MLKAAFFSSLLVLRPECDDQTCGAGRGGDRLPRLDGSSAELAVDAPRRGALR